MNTKAFLRDWQPGDIVTADDMQALADTVAMLESAGPTGGAAPGGSCRRVTDGPQGWPWQVVALHGEDKYELRVVPGKVLAGIRTTGYGEGLGEEEVAYTYLELPAIEGADVVQDYDATKDAATVYLELTGRVARRYLTWGDMLAAGLMDDPYGMITDADKARKTGHEVVTLEDAALRVTCAPVDTALRIWPLAVVNKEHKQPVTQLQWGDLSALECRGVAVDVAGGDVLWPTPWENGAAWGTTAHAQGMICVTQIEFSTDVERIEGELYGCLDTDGSLEFYLGEYNNKAQDDNSELDSEIPDDYDPETETTDDDYTPPSGGESEDDEELPPDESVLVRYGYEAGEGFTSCTLVRKGGKLYWKLLLDSADWNERLKNFKVPAQVTLKASGSQPAAGGVTVAMGLKSTSVVAGAHLQATAVLEFAGTDNDDVSWKSDTKGFAYQLEWPGKAVKKYVWYLSPSVLSSAAGWVKMMPSNGASVFNVTASQWYIFSIDFEKWEKYRVEALRKALAEVRLQASATQTREDTTITATLSGNLGNVVASAVMS